MMKKKEAIAILNEYAVRVIGFPRARVSTTENRPIQLKTKCSSKGMFNIVCCLNDYLLHKKVCKKPLTAVH